MINTWNGEKVELKISSDEFCYCPVCGEKAINEQWRPYDENGHPSYEKSWENYREKWLNGKADVGFGKKMSMEEKLVQLKNLEL